jgi:hypothetical protein
MAMHMPSTRFFALAALAIIVLVTIAQFGPALFSGN